MPTYSTVVGTVHVEDFSAVAATLRIFERRLDNQLVESRELHVTVKPQSKEVRRAFDSMIFRIVDEPLSPGSDKNGRPIVGGVNTFPEPVHVVLAVTPTAFALLNQRVTHGHSLTFSLTLAENLLSWDQAASLPVYEASIIS